MPISLLDAVDFSRIPSLQFTVPIVPSDPTGYQAGLIFNTTDSALKYHNGSVWVVVATGSEASGSAGGDLTGSYPNPQIAAGVIVDADVNASAAIQQSKVQNLTSDLAGKATTSQLANYQLLSGKGVASGYAPLDAAGLVPTAHVPPLAINEVWTVASEAEMLALSAQRGDMAIRTDNGLTYVLSTDVPTAAANWKQVTAAGQVLSVNGKTGVVTISLGELGGVPTTRQVIAGAGLTGGGALSSDVTLNVVSSSADLTVGADAVTVVSAPKWSAARTLSLTGDATGSASIDGSANVSIATTVVNAAKRYAADVGAGTSVTVNHGLGTRDVVVSVHRSTSPWDVIQCGVEITSTTSVTLKFASAVVASAYRVVVLA